MTSCVMYRERTARPMTTGIKGGMWARFKVVLQRLRVISASLDRTVSRCRKAYILPLRFFFFLSFLISEVTEVTERISNLDTYSAMTVV